MSANLVIGAVASASAIAGMGISYIITRNHYKKYEKYIPKWGSDGKFTKRN